MKIKRLVGLLAELTPHAYSDSVVLMWLSQCENSILTDVFLIAPEETVEYEEVTEDKLLVPHPYDKLYLPYLQAQVAHANQEYDLYANLMALYNAYRYEYAQYIVAGAEPGSGDAVRRGYYLSAYGIAVAHGYAGTEEEWIASLKGAAGAPGEPGMSAYEEALEQGFEGTKAEWLASLKGEDGLSAYEAALEQGFEGTEAEWIASLKGAAGAPGEPGMSAYEEALEQGFEGTKAEWLASLKGEDGLSAYEAALEQGFEGTEAEWLESIKGSEGRQRVTATAAEDGISYAAEVPGLTVESGREILLVPTVTNQGEATLAINGGEAYALTYRPGYLAGGTDLRPTLRLPVEEEMLLRGGEYVFRFDGIAWVLMSHVAVSGTGGGRVFVQEEEPENAQEGDVWIDPNEETVTLVTRTEMQAYVAEAIADALAGMPNGEEMLFG